MAQGSTYNFRFTGDLDKMARFLEEQEEEEQPASLDAPSSDTPTFITNGLNMIFAHVANFPQLLIKQDIDVLCPKTEVYDLSRVQ